MDHRRILKEKILTTMYKDLFPADDNTKYQEIFQKITGEISYFVEFVPKLKQNKELDNRFKNAKKAAVVYHSEKNIIKLRSKEKYNKGFYIYAQNLSDLENGPKLCKDSSVVDSFLTKLMKSLFEKILSEKAFFLWNPKDCEILNKKLHFSLKAALALTYMELVDPDGMKSEMIELRDKLVICSAMVSTIHIHRWKISGFANFITNRLPTIKLGLEPEEFDSFTIMYLHKFWREDVDLKEDFDFKSRIRRRIQTCLKQHLPRQNESAESMDGRRKKSTAAYAAYCHYLGIDKFLTPYENKEKLGSSFSQKVNASYHNDAVDLYKVDHILNGDYGVSDKGDLTINGIKASQDEFLMFLQKWTLREIKTLRSFKPTKKRKTLNEDIDTERLTLAFRSVFGRYCFEMSIPNDIDIPGARIKWQNHIAIITAFSVLVAVFDELCHLEYGEQVCGIATVVTNELCKEKESNRTSSIQLHESLYKYQRRYKCKCASCKISNNCIDFFYIID